jgi:hypothetical protein
MICTTSLFRILAPTCFGSSLPSSGSILDPSELLEIQIELVISKIYKQIKRISVYNISCKIKRNE